MADGRGVAGFRWPMAVAWQDSDEGMTTEAERLAAESANSSYKRELALKEFSKTEARRVNTIYYNDYRQRTRTDNCDSLQRTTTE